MKNLKKDSAVYKMLLLGIVCAVCGLLLSGANAVTAPIIEQNKLNTVKSKLEMIYPGGEFEDITDQYIGLDDTGLIDEDIENGMKSNNKTQDCKRTGNPQAQPVPEIKQADSYDHAAYNVHGPRAEAADHQMQQI